MPLTGPQSARPMAAAGLAAAFVAVWVPQAWSMDPSSKTPRARIPRSFAEAKTLPSVVEKAAGAAYKVLTNTAARRFQLKWAPARATGRGNAPCLGELQVNGAFVEAPQHLFAMLNALGSKSGKGVSGPGVAPGEKIEVGANGSTITIRHQQDVAVLSYKFLVNRAEGKPALDGVRARGSDKQSELEVRLSEGHDDVRTATQVGDLVQTIREINGRRRGLAVQCAHQAVFAVELNNYGGVQAATYVPHPMLRAWVPTQKALRWNGVDRAPFTVRNGVPKGRSWITSVETDGLSHAVRQLVEATQPFTARTGHIAAAIDQATETARGPWPQGHGVRKQILDPFVQFLVLFIDQQGPPSGG